MSNLTILVTGATGKQGGNVARQLLTKGHKVRALTRKPDSSAARQLQERGAELAIGNLEDRAALEQAMQGVASGDRNKGVPHFDSKWEVEQYIRALVIPHSIVAPAGFMENTLADWAIEGLKQGKYSPGTKPPESPMIQIAAEDIASKARADVGTSRSLPQVTGENCG